MICRTLSEIVLMWTRRSGFALAAILLAAAFVLLFLRKRRQVAGDFDAGGKPHRKTPPVCPHCSMALMPVETEEIRGCFLCPVCGIRYRPLDDAAGAEGFPEGYVEETEWADESDPTNDGTFFGI